MRPGDLPMFVVLIVSIYTALAHAAAESPVRGCTLVVTLAADPGHLNPAITMSGATHAAAELLYNGLLGRDEHGEPHPELVESGQVEQAGALYRFRLRQGVTWLVYAWLDPHIRYE